MEEQGKAARDRCRPWEWMGKEEAVFWVYF